MDRNQTTNNQIAGRALQQVIALKSKLSNTGENGFMLIEAMVACAVIVTVSYALIYLVVGLLSAPATAMSKGNQITGIQQTAQAITAPLSTADAQSIGTHDVAGAINPTSMAGDQIIFTASNGSCYRFWYDAAHKEIREVENNLGCGAIDSSRGPNEERPTDCFPPDQMPAPCDHILDGMSQPWVVATDVTTDAQGGTDGRIFTYYDYNHTPWQTDTNANSDSQNPLYHDEPGTEVNVGSVQINYWQASPGVAQNSVPPIEYKQVVTLQLPAS